MSSKETRSWTHTRQPSGLRTPKEHRPADRSAANSGASRPKSSCGSHTPLRDSASRTSCSVHGSMALSVPSSRVCRQSRSTSEGCASQLRSKAGLLLKCGAKAFTSFAGVQWYLSPARPRFTSASAVSRPRPSSTPGSAVSTWTCTRSLRTSDGKPGKLSDCCIASLMPMGALCTFSAAAGMFTFFARHRAAAACTLSPALRLVLGVPSGTESNMAVCSGTFASCSTSLPCPPSTTRSTSSTTRTGWQSLRSSRARPVDSSSRKSCFASSLQLSTEIPSAPSIEESACMDHGGGISVMSSIFASGMTNSATLARSHHASDLHTLSGQRTLG
mmetsp:Transcript_24398/g.66583  ORF Transcript_24398/g.66583 Transcript_24398/m.66583 type:complete len:331 (+) Transcript_24398:450-1442(+)